MLIVGASAVSCKPQLRMARPLWTKPFFGTEAKSYGATSVDGNKSKAAKLPTAEPDRLFHASEWHSEMCELASRAENLMLFYR